MRNSLLKTGLVAAMAIATATRMADAQEQEEVDITLEEVGKGVYMLTGRGGNIGVWAGDDGVFLIDDQYAPLTPEIRRAVAKISDEPVRFVFNTHWHGDHTGGNENFGKAGSVIVAHDNVRKRLAAGQIMNFVGQEREVPPAPEAALPVVTFDNTVTFHLNGDELHAFHVRNAHTDGDAILRFRNANVVHMGDVYFSGYYPFIDASSGGSLAGMIGAIDRALELIDEETRVIPGHGPLADRAGLESYRNMLATVHGRIELMIDEGLSLEAIQAQRPTSEFDAEWGDGFIPPDQWVGLIYREMTD
ncbi:MAG TPA: MBL fold metallo-hydrolase [Gammaproteobacteria bacterium]|nr:MBL fold metallo-hydrolase [Gammaproteobacteria bacterium]